MPRTRPSRPGALATARATLGLLRDPLRGRAVRHALLAGLVAGSLVACTGGDAEAPETPAADGSTTTSGGGTGDATDRSQAPAEASALVLTSPDADAANQLPASATGSFQSFCDGENVSPTLTWTGAPEGTAGFAVTMVDLQNPGFVHWVVSGIPAGVTTIEAAPDGQVGVGVVGSSLAGSGRYVGPCDPARQYAYVLYALDEPITGTTGTAMSSLLGLIQGHVLDSSELVVTRTP